MDVVGLGVSFLDIVQLVDHFPSKEEVQRAFDLAIQGGGPVATAIVALARLGANVAMVDAVGDDWRAELVLQEYQREGVCIDYIQRKRGRTTGLACILVDRNSGARTIVYSPGTASELLPADLPRALIESAGYLHVNGRQWEASLEAIAWARRAGVQVSFDGGAHRFREEMKGLVPLTDICIVARDFAERYTREVEVDKAAQVLLDAGPGLVIITDGIKGSWVRSREGRAFHQPAYVLPDVVDTTGCGDSYHGAALFGLLKGMRLRAVVSFASAVAALNARCLGGRRGLPTFEQAMTFLSNYEESLWNL